jgi:hypothetical protein
MQEALVSKKYISENYINDMEKHYIRLFGETSDTLFPKNR